MRTHASLALASFASLSLAACGDPGPGRIEVTVYGQAFIEDSIPASVFADGWSVAFEMFLVTIGGAAIQGGHDDVELTVPGFQIYDLSQASGGRGYTLATLDAPGGTYDHFGYVIRPEPTATAGNAFVGDAVALVASGKSVRVKGTATKDARLVWFDWSFGQSLTHLHCAVDRTVDGDTVTMQATLHADHLFHDDLVAPDRRVAFELIAAADGADGTPPNNIVTAEELAATDLRGETRYQVGALPIDDLWGFLGHQLGTIGRANGDGVCAEIQVQGE